MSREGGLRLEGVSKGLLPGNPLVTIITATFNIEGCLPHTIESIRNRTYKNIEWIVVDGASTDGTIELLRQNEDAIDYWISEPDNGIFDAWNKGVSLANGEWIAFLGAGDSYKAEAIEGYINAIKACSIRPDFVSSRVSFVNNRGMAVRVKGAPFEWELFKNYMTIAHVGAFHHRSLFERYGLFEKSYVSAADYEFLMRCGSSLKTLYLDMVTAEMVVGGASDSYVGLKEAYRIQRQYGMNIILAKFRLWVACAKRYIRPIVRRY